MDQLLRLDLSVLIDVSSSQSTLAVDLVALKCDAVEAICASKLRSNGHVAAHKNAIENLYIR